MKRAGISKRVRFTIFARDGFRCRYCGRLSDEVTLVIDHLLPVVEGGGNDEENLVTSCEPCNQGKAARVLAAEPPDDPLAQLARRQELNEQRQAAESVRAIQEANAALGTAMVDAWCGIRGTEKVDAHTIDVMSRYAREHGVAAVMEWIEVAHQRLPRSQDYQVGRYVSGIRRSKRAEGAL